MLSEKKIQTEIAKGLSSNGTTVFRNNVGNGWTGILSFFDRVKSIVTLTNVRRIQFGLCVGSSDLIGLTPLIITEKMVGSKVAIFTAIEVKSKKGRLTKEQENFIDFINNSGGMAGVAKSKEDAINLVKRKVSGF